MGHTVRHILPENWQAMRRRVAVQQGCGHWAAVKPSDVQFAHRNCDRCKEALRTAKPTEVEEMMRLAGYTYQPNLMGVQGMTEAEARAIEQRTIEFEGYIKQARQRVNAKTAPLAEAAA